MTVVADIDRLRKVGYTPRKHREPSGNTMSRLFRLCADGVLTAGGIVIYTCPHCNNPQACRPPEWLLPPMVWQTATICCDKNINVRVAGRVQR